MEFRKLQKTLKSGFFLNYEKYNNGSGLLQTEIIHQDSKDKQISKLKKSIHELTNLPPLPYSCKLTTKTGI